MFLIGVTLTRFGSGTALKAFANVSSGLRAFVVKIFRHGLRRKYVRFSNNLVHLSFTLLGQSMLFFGMK
jgi:hypothetical protein